MEIRKALISGINILTRAKLPTAALDVEIILAYTISKTKEFLFSYPEKELTPLQQKSFIQKIKLRAKQIPVAYIIGEKDFFNLNFKINKYVLIPRPETELLVEHALKLVKENYQKQVTIADIGTGSGAIAIALAKNLPHANILATDKSIKALLLAKINSRENNVKIKLYKGNLIDPIKKIPIDIVVTNLPYIKEKEQDLLNLPETKGLKYEPALALYSGSDGLDSYRELIAQINKMEVLPQFVLLEHGHEQAPKLIKIILNLFPKAQIESFKDLAGFDRYLVWKN